MCRRGDRGIEPRRRRPFRAGELRRRLQHRDLSGTRGAPTAFATALGDDPYSDAIVSLSQVERIDTDLIVRVPGRLPGIALVDADAKGERRSHDWRSAAPAAELFELPNWSRTAESLLTAKLIYFSGITLSLYSNLGLGRFLAAVELARGNGAKIAFDGNFRPRAWHGRSHAHPHRVRGSAQARRHRAPRL
ncbi:MAG: PfkB family carbohydrate kinase [Pseudolabrys sp.]